MTNAAPCIGPTPGQYLDSRELRDECSIEGTPFMRPWALQSLLTIRTFLMDRCRQQLNGGSLLVLAVDGISFDVAAASWSPDLLVPITSTFPTTSSTAWITALTGLSPDRHLVPGVVYYDPDRSALYNCLTDSFLSPDGEWRTVSTPACREAMFHSTIFTELSSEGVECVANAGDLTSLPGRWPGQLLAGARTPPPIADQDAIRMHPQAMVATAIAEIERALNERTRGARLFLWTYINLDEYVHYHGYDAALVESLHSLEAATKEWTCRGHSVIAHSDHGLVPNCPDETLESSWQAVNRHDFCRHPPGGAGRVLWCYPRPGREHEVYERVSDIFRGQAAVLFRDELAVKGILSIGPVLKKMIGEVVVLAKGERFPAAGSRLFEHGSLMPGEMLTALAVWSATML